MASQRTRGYESATARREALLAQLKSGDSHRSAAELAATLGVSSRTIERDIAKFRRSGLKIAARAGRTGGVSFHSESRSSYTTDPPVPADLTSLSKSTSTVLHTAAVIGNTFERTLLKAVVQLPGLPGNKAQARHVDHAFDELLDRGVFAGSRGEPILGFRHPEHRVSVLQGATAAGLKSTNLRVGQELECQRNSGIKVPASRIASHFIQAGNNAVSHLAVKYALIAGQECARENDHTGAVRWYRWITELEDGSSDSESRLAAKTGLARALSLSSPRSGIPEAARLLREIVDEHLANGELHKAVEVAQIDCPSISDPPGATDIAGMIEVVLGSAEPDPAALGNLLALHARAVMTERQDARAAQESIDRASAIARELEDPDIQLNAQQARLGFDFNVGRLESTIRLAGTTVPEAVRLKNTQVEFRARFQLVTSLRLSGRIDRATQAAEEMLARSQLVGMETAVEQSTGSLASIDIIKGRFGSALARAAVIRDRFGSTGWTVLPTALLGVYDHSSTGLDVDREFGSRVSTGRWILPIEAALLSLSIGHIEPSARQQRRLRQLIRSFDEGGGTPGAGVQRLALGLLLDSLEGTDRRGTQRGLTAFYGWHDYFIGFGGVPVPAVIGLAVARVEGHRQAAPLFDRAIELAREVGALPQLACALVNRAVAGENAGQVPTDDARLVEAGQIARRLGMNALLHRIAVIQESADSIPHQSTGPLTMRETEVLGLIAAGRTTREISDTLFITESTVTRHTTNILEKIGARNRVEATGYAYRLGIIE